MTVRELGSCRACKAEMLWCVMPSGKRNPLDPDGLQLGMVLRPDGKVAPGVVAYNPQNGHGRVVKADDSDRLRGWSELGVSFHVSHFATCPQRERFQTPKATEATV